MKVFINYRRADVGGYAGRLKDALEVRLGVDAIFQDVVTIGAGRDFVQEINRALARADAVLAVIGPGWLRASTSEGRRRLLQPDDPVRTELVQALASGLPVVPVLVGGAAMPVAEDLPPDLAGLADRQAVVIRDEAFHGDVDRLISSLRGGPSRTTRRNRRRLLVVSALVVVVVAAAATWVVLNRITSTTTDSTSTMDSCEDQTTPDWTQVAMAGRPSASVGETTGPVLITITAAAFRSTQAGQWQLELTTQMENGTTDSTYLGPWFFRDAEVAKRAAEPTCFTPPASSIPPGELVEEIVGFRVVCRPDRSVAVILQSSTIDSNKLRLPITPGEPSADCSTGNT